MSPPAFQFYPDDFIGGTVVFSAQECGAYIRLLCYQWGTGKIPDSKEALERVAGCPVSGSVLAKFPAGKNQRLERERRKQAEYRKSQSLKGKASAKARFNRGSNPVDVRFQPKVNSPSPSPSPSPVGGKPPTTPGAVAPVDVAPVRDPLASFPENFRTDRMVKQWATWMEVRREMKKPKSWETFFNHQLDWLKTYDEEQAYEILGQSIRNGWQGLFDPKQPALPHVNGNGHISPVSKLKSAKELLEAAERAVHVADSNGDQGAFQKAREERNRLRGLVAQLNREVAGA